MKRWLKPSVDWLLVFALAAAALEYLSPESSTLIFFSASLALAPAAAWLGRATEHLASRTNESIGALLNATFGNAAEFIIALAALRSGLTGVVKASLAGSILSNLLLVLGAAALAGGVRFKMQNFNPVAARSQATLLTLAAIGLVVPAFYHHLAGPVPSRLEADLSLEIAAVLLATYGLGLLFSLRTHRQYFSSGAEPQEEGIGAPWSVRRSLLTLGAATALVAWLSESLVGALGGAAQTLGMTTVFTGVIVVGVLGNAAEHSTAIFAARANRMDLAVGIAVGSSIQIALFVAPALVFASRLIGPQPMDLVFTAPEALAIVVSVWIAGQISSDGESNWLEGVQLLAVYLMLGIVFYFLPETQAAAAVR